MTNDLKIGKIIRIENLRVLVEITDNNLASNISLISGINDYVVSVNKFVYSNLPNGKKIVARIVKIYDRDLFVSENIFVEEKGKLLIEVDLVGIYDDVLNKFDTGINSFPIIGALVYAINYEIYSSILKIDAKYSIEIGTSYNDSMVNLYANPDILLGKHMGVFGNTGTGKSCTVASVLQGIKRRLKKQDGSSIQVKPKIIIFDSNNEYERAFPIDEFKILKVNKANLKLPHHVLSYTEYYKFLSASQGVQAPVLKATIDRLREKYRKQNTDNNIDPNSFPFEELHDEIINYISEKSQGKDFNYNQWYGWNSTLLNRISQIIEDDRIFPIINTTENTIDNILNSDAEVILIDADFDKDEFDIIVFLFGKLLYNWAIHNREKGDIKNILVLFEEAHRYINEEDSNEYKLGNYYIERLAREGRKYGVSLIISSQRPSELSKTVLSQCNSFIIHRISNKNDLEFINRLLSASNSSLLSLLPGLERQYALVIGEAFGYSDIIKINTAKPTPSSDDPEVIRNWINVN